MTVSRTRRSMSHTTDGTTQAVWDRCRSCSCSTAAAVLGMRPPFSASASPHRLLRCQSILPIPYELQGHSTSYDFYRFLLIFTDFSPIFTDFYRFLPIFTDFLGRPSFYLLLPSSTFFHLQLPSTFFHLLGRERDPREDPLGAGRIP